MVHDNNIAWSSSLCIDIQGTYEGLGDCSALLGPYHWLFGSILLPAAYQKRQIAQHTVMTEKRVCQIQVAASALRPDHKKRLETTVVDFGRRYKVHAAK